MSHGGADIAEANDAGENIWEILVSRLLSVHLGDEAVAEVTALLRVSVVRGAPPVDFGA
jgi:hypothetical protein